MQWRISTDNHPAHSKTIIVFYPDNRRTMLGKVSPDDKTMIVLDNKNYAYLAEFKPFWWAYLPYPWEQEASLWQRLKSKLLKLSKIKSSK